MKNQRYPKILLAMVSLLLLVLPMTARAQFYFTTSNEVITITGYIGPGGDVTIPSTINGYPVKSIGTYAFYYCETLKSVIIPDSITNIGNWAFYHCSGLTNITIGSGVIMIGNYVFMNCTSLTSVTIPDAVTSVGNTAFCNCSHLTSVTIGNTVTNIGDWAFEYCSSLTRVTIPDSVTSIGTGVFYGSSITNIDVNAANPNYASVGGVLFNKAMTILIDYPAGRTSSYYAIPNSVTTIDIYAFSHCSSLTSVTIPDSVTSIGSSAFWYCSSLTSVMIPDSVTSISFDAFANCSNLTTVTIPNSVTNIDEGAFWYCSSLTSVMIPDSVTSIGDAAFYECSSLTRATIGNSVTSIGTKAFYECSSLTNIDVNAANPIFASVGGVLFNKAMTMLIEYPGGLTGSYAIPNSVTSIGDYAFSRCSSLTSVTIPNSVTSIGISAFAYCTNLHLAYFTGNAPSADYSVFLPEYGKVYYLPGTTGWGTTFGGWLTAWWYKPQPQILSLGYGLGVLSNKFQFTISWGTNTSVAVEASTNLLNWTPVITNALVHGTNRFNDLEWTNYPQRFYRVRSQ